MTADENAPMADRGGDSAPIDIDDVPTEAVSICAGCAKHPELHALVTSDLTAGACGACGSTTKQVFNPKRFREARDLIRALIRLHIDEEFYNPHWGGSSVDTVLLAEENLILNHGGLDVLNDDLIHRIVWDDDDGPDGPGISLHGGHDDHYGRGLLFAIHNTADGQLNDIIRRLKTENFHSLEGAMGDLIDVLLGEIEALVDTDRLWFRSRIGVADEAIHLGDHQVHRIAVPYKGDALGALPPPIANANRMNRQGVSVLYVASEIDTALAEIRPHPAQLLSIGGFRPSRRLRVANFDVPIAGFAANDERLATLATIYHIDTLLSTPIVPEERHRYAVTQLLTDILIRRGFEGVMYRSSVGAGKNLCAFNPADFIYDESTAAVRQVTKLAYEFANVAMSIEDTRRPFVIADD